MFEFHDRPGVSETTEISPETESEKVESLQGP